MKTMRLALSPSKKKTHVNCRRKSLKFHVMEKENEEVVELDYTSIYEEMKDKIDAEFVKLFPEVESMLGRFPSSYTNRILSYVLHKRMDIEERIGKVHDENLSSLIYLANLLPVTGLKKRKLDDDRPNFPSEALITFAGINSSFESIIQKRRCRQPYLMTTAKEEEKIFFSYIR